MSALFGCVRCPDVMDVAKKPPSHTIETASNDDVAVGDILSAAILVGRFAIAMAGQGAHRTAVDNARAALAEAQRRAQERREVDAVFAAIAHASRPPFTADGTPARTAAR